MNNIINSEISCTAKIYKDVRIKDSTINDYAVVADRTDIVGSVLMNHAEIGRNGMIRNCVIGQGTYTGSNAVIKNTDINKFCSISWNVSIGGLQHSIDAASTYSNYWWKRVFDVNIERKENDEKTVIGNDVWIGSGATILSGVTIGNGSIIGAGAVVTKDIPAYAIAVGVPAKVVRQRFSDDIIIRLQKLEWWNWPNSYIIEAAKLLSRPIDDITIERLEELKKMGFKEIIGIKEKSEF